MIVRIDDAADARLDEYRRLRDPDRRRQGLFVGEQALIVAKMLAIPGLTRSVLVSEGDLRRLPDSAVRSAPVYVVPTDVMASVAGFDVHRGVLALGYRAPLEGRRPLDVVPPAPGAACVLACEGITNSDNIGLLMRNAAAFGVAAVVLDPLSHDPLYRRSLRVSIGHALTVPWARAARWPEDLAALRLKRGLTLLAATTAMSARPIDQVGALERCALVVGTEGAGLAASTIDLCDEQVRVPMAAGVDSLNVAVAAAVCLHRLCRPE